VVRISRRTLAAAAIAAIVALLVVPALAAADGDPASDVLLAENVFYPYEPATSPPLQDQLNAETAAAAKLHVPIKVALIASRIDLGTIPEVFGRPQEYAPFLDREISFTATQQVLVVMANGYGTSGLPAAAVSAVAALPKPSGGSSDELATAALTAVDKIAAAEGHPLAGSAAATDASGSAGGGGTLVLVIVLVVVALLATGALAMITLRRRRSPASGRP
jgi:hypothetical protein